MKCPGTPRMSLQLRSTLALFSAAFAASTAHAQPAASPTTWSAWA